MNQPQPPRMRRPRYHVWLAPADPADEPVYHGVVTVTHGDQLRAELDAATHKLPSMSAAPMNATTMWVWAAMVRTGDYGDKFHKFKTQDLAELAPVGDDEAGEDSDADPTMPGPS